MTRRRIYAWLTEQSACFDYRERLPLTHLPADQWEVAWGPALPPDIHDYDVVVGQRLTGAAHPQWFALCADPGLLCVFDMDDDLINIDPANTVPHQIYAPQADDTRRLVAASDVVTVCTPHVQGEMSKINPNVVLLPICMDPALLRKPEPHGERLTLGWAGSVFHHQDWQVLPGQLHKVAPLLPHVDFHAIGHDFTQGAFAGRTRTSGHLGWFEHVQRLDFDLGVAPLLRSEWNKGKSWTKLLEYGARGIPALAEEWGQYRDFINDGMNGVVIGPGDSWAGWLEGVLTDDVFRAELAAGAYATAESLTIDKHAYKWARVYEGHF